MKILLTGSTGWVGKSLGIDLCRKGHELVCLVRDVERAKGQLPFPAKLLKWNGYEDLPSDAMDGVNAIVHLMGEPVADGRWTEDRKKSILASRVISTKILKAAAIQHQVQVFVSASAIGFYGDRGDDLLTEESSQGEGFLADVCQKWEEQALSDETKIRCVAVRIGVVLGKNGGALEKMKMPYEIGVGGPIGGGKQWLSWIHIEDLKGILIRAAEDNQLSGIYNAVAPEPCRQRDFSKHLAKSLHAFNFTPTPALALKLIFGEMATVLLASTQVIPTRLERLGFKYQFSILPQALENIFAAEGRGEKELEVFQYVERPREEIFPFFSDEKNLEILTPKFLNFKVLNKSTDQIKVGTLINYELSLHGVPMKWQTRIDQWQPPSDFVDTQIKGPYRLWHHLHEFEKLGPGTLLKDRIRYKLPFGKMGRLTAGWKVDADVRSIFDFRHKKIRELFGSKDS